MGKFLLTQVAAVAELAAGLIGERTKKALAAAKARGARREPWQSERRSCT
jgi:DNA invertase Pin-like site-specific DNA recombinase